MFFKENVNIKEVIKWGVLTGLVEGLLILGVAIVWFKRGQILPLPGSWEFAATVIILFLLSVSTVVATVLLIWHPYQLICRGNKKESLWTVMAAGLTLLLFIVLIIFASRVLI